jgi:hypothetical protein
LATARGPRTSPVRTTTLRPRITPALSAIADLLRGETRDVIEKFDFDAQVGRLDRAKLLYLAVSKVIEVGLHPDKVTNVKMGHLHEDGGSATNEGRRTDELADGLMNGRLPLDHLSPRHASPQAAPRSRSAGTTGIASPAAPGQLRRSDLLKKTRQGNLFTIIGQPDIETRGVGQGQLQVEIHGPDTHNPTTSEVVSQASSEIACGFIDTAYDNRQFFVRHAYSLGDDDHYDKLRRALRADIDEAAWSSLNSTVSRPFPAPESGSIAIKVINHYGDEILKVCEVRSQGA